MKDLTSNTKPEQVFISADGKVIKNILGLKKALKDRTPMYLAHSTLLKMQDIVNMCEQVRPDAKLQLLELKKF